MKRHQHSILTNILKLFVCLCLVIWATGLSQPRAEQTPAPEAAAAEAEFPGLNEVIPKANAVWPKRSRRWKHSSAIGRMSSTGH